MNRATFAFVLALAITASASPASGQFVFNEAGPRVDSIIQLAEERSPTFGSDMNRLRAHRGSQPRSLVITEPGSVHTNPDVKVPDNWYAMTAHNDNRIAVVILDAERIAADKLSDNELLQVLVHEVYGHALSILLEGEACADPKRGRPYRTSCVANREAQILDELGLAPRQHYSIRTH